MRSLTKRSKTKKVIGSLAALSLLAIVPPSYANHGPSGNIGKIVDKCKHEFSDRKEFLKCVRENAFSQEKVLDKGLNDLKSYSEKKGTDKSTEVVVNNKTENLFLPIVETRIKYVGRNTGKYSATMDPILETRPSDTLRLFNGVDDFTYSQDGDWITLSSRIPVKGDFEILYKNKDPDHLPAIKVFAYKDGKPFFEGSSKDGVIKIPSIKEPGKVAIKVYTPIKSYSKHVGKYGSGGTYEAGEIEIAHGIKMNRWYK